MKVSAMHPCQRGTHPADRAESPHLTSRLARGSATAFVIYTAGAGLTYCSQLVIARVVGPSGYGVYAYALAWMTVLAYFVALGFDVSLLRFIPAYRARNEWPLLRGILLYADRSVALAGIGVVCAGALILTFAANGMPEGEKETFFVGLTLVPALALLWIRCAAIRAFGDVLAALAPDRIVRDGVLAALAGIAGISLTWAVGAPLMMAFTVIGALSALALAVFFTRRQSRGEIAAVAPAYTGAIWARTGASLVLIGVADIVMNRTGALLLGWMGHTTEAGIYALAFNVAFLVVLPRTAVNALYAPTVSGLFAQNNHSDLQALVTKAASWTLVGGSLLGLVLVMFAGSLLSWFGRDFESGSRALQILAIGQVIAAGAGSQLYLMTMTGHERMAAILSVSSTVLNAIMGVLLINAFGLVGAAIATAAAMIIWNVFMALYIWRNLNVIPGLIAVFLVPLRAMPSFARSHAPGRTRA